MIQVMMQCDKCGSTAQIVGGFQRYNNDIIGYPIPENWFFAIDTVLCSNCLQKAAKREVDGIKENE